MPETREITIESGVATFANIVLPMGLQVASLELTGSGFTLSSDPFRIFASSTCSVRATVVEGDVASFLRAKAPSNITFQSVRLVDGQIHIAAAMQVLITITAQAVCRLVIVDRKQLVVELDSVEVLGMGGKGLVQKQLDEINPLLDVSDLPVAMELLTVDILNREIVLTGGLKLPSSP